MSKTIKEISEIKKSEYESEYKEWCENNPGKIMNGLTSKILATQDSEYCNNIEELDFLIRLYEGKHKFAMEKYNVSGWNFAKNAIIDIKETYLNQKL